MGTAAAFIELALAREVIRFGQFTLKSGRVSPYFFNLGAISSGAGLSLLANCYANAVLDSGLGFDMLFGPAYKGIPLAAALSMALHARTGRDVAFAYNRKEAKAHGEGGSLAGAPLCGRVLIVDDVITAGTAVSEAIAIIRRAGAQPVGLVVAFDREERAPDAAASALKLLAANERMTTIAVATLSDLAAQMAHDPALTPAIDAYRARYGATDIHRPES